MAKSYQGKVNALTADTSGLSDARLVVISAATDVSDPSTWTEVSAFATTNRPQITSGKWSAVASSGSGASRVAQRTMPTDANWDIGAFGGSGGTVHYLAVVDGTGALGSSTDCRIIDTDFNKTYAASDHIIINQNSQTFTEK